MSRRFGPRKAEHIDPGRVCQACKKPFAVGDYTLLVPLGPGDDTEERKKRDEGRFYNAIAIEIHWDCADNDYRDK